METIVIPKFIAEYLIYTYLLVSILEGIILNIGLKRAFYTPKGLLLSAMLNFATFFSSFFFLRVFYFENINYNFLMGFILCVAVEFYFADFMLSTETSKINLFLSILIGNLLSFLIVWLNAGWLF